MRHECPCCHQEIGFEERTKRDAAELREAARNFWAFIQGEYGVRLSAEDQEDHSVTRFFAALGVTE